MNDTKSLDALYIKIKCDAEDKEYFKHLHVNDAPLTAKERRILAIEKEKRFEDVLNDLRNHN